MRKILCFCLLNFLSVLATTVGLEGQSSGIGAVLNYTTPLFVFCMAVPFLMEKISMVRILGVVVGFIGIISLFIGKLDYSFSLISSLIMLLGAFLEALTNVYYKKSLSHVDPIITRFLFALVSTFLLLILIPFDTGFIFPAQPEYLGLVLFSSIGALTLGWITWLYLLRREDTTVLSGSSLVIPVVALVLGWQFMGETISVESIFGSALVLAGVYLVNHRKQDDN